MCKSCILLAILIVLKSVTSARILAVAPIPSYSHQIFYRPIWLELAKRGHQLTLLTTDPMGNPPNSINQIDWHQAYDLRHKKHNITKVIQEYEYNLPKILDSFQAMLNEIVDEELSHPEVQLMLNNKTEHFDLLIAEYFSPAMFGFSERFKCPYITISSLEISNSYHQALGNPIHPVLYPEVLMPFERNLNFKERFLSTLFFFYGFYRKVYSDGKEEALAKKYFGEKLPSLDTISRKVSMVFVNTNPVFSVRPLGPGFVQIGGGIHLTKQKRLPKDIESFLDSAEKGAIYFSLGTNVRSHYVKGIFLKAVLETFKELPYKILWKFETDLPENYENVKIMRWLPQQDVLRHRNVKLFMTQCGAQSMEESIFAGVPMLAIPFVSDQKMNAQKIVGHGLGLIIDKNTVTKRILMSRILEMMTNSSFREAVDRTARLMADQPMSGLEKAVWWTEYVIRHNGVKHFWHPNINMPVYQYLLLDVMTVMFFIAFVFIYCTYKIIVSISSRLSEKEKRKEKTD